MVEKNDVEQSSVSRVRILDFHRLAGFDIITVEAVSVLCLLQFPTDAMIIAGNESVGVVQIDGRAYYTPTTSKGIVDLVSRERTMLTEDLVRNNECWLSWPIAVTS